MIGDDELLTFAADDEPPLADPPTILPWQILVVDDDREVHAITRLALRGFAFMGRPVEFLSAYTAWAGAQMLRQNPGVSVVLLDVVMEEEHAGLCLVRTIREDHNNQAIRIILRTGQPGYAPESQILTDYDINDYRSKTELTPDRLRGCLISALRSYRYCQQLADSNIGMVRIIDAVSGMVRTRAMDQLLKLALARLTEIARGSGDAVFCVRQRDRLTLAETTRAVDGLGRWAGTTARRLRDILDEDETQAMERALSEGGPDFATRRILLPLVVSGRWTGAILLTGPFIADPGLWHRIELFGTVLSAALDNFYRLEELRSSQKATVLALAEMAEKRDTNTGEHVLRVGRLASEIARELRQDGPYAGLIDDLFVETIGPASMLHDLGKVGVPDQILKKPGPLDAAERKLMETHTWIGARSLDKIGRLAATVCYLSVGQEIALSHHEWFDGTGYPNQLKGEAIPLAARITAIADVFDALIMPRAYKPAWPLKKAFDYIAAAAGSQFDPVVVRAFQTIIERRFFAETVQWTADMSVGDAGLDDEHRSLIHLINQLSIDQARYDRLTIELALDELTQYVDFHFSHEEQYMARIGYPGLEQHQRQHAALTRQVLTLRHRFFDALPDCLNNEIIDLLRGWLSNHILTADMAYRTFLDRHGQSPASSG
jgi:hemerythrin-like metal-binding protein